MTVRNRRLMGLLILGLVGCGSPENSPLSPVTGGSLSLPQILAGGALEAILGDPPDSELLPIPAPPPLKPPVLGDRPGFATLAMGLDKSPTFELLGLSNDGFARRLSAQPAPSRPFGMAWAGDVLFTTNVVKGSNGELGAWRQGPEGTLVKLGSQVLAGDSAPVEPLDDTHVLAVSSRFAETTNSILYVVSLGSQGQLQTRPAPFQAAYSTDLAVYRSASRTYVVVSNAISKTLSVFSYDGASGQAFQVPGSPFPTVRPRQPGAVDIIGESVYVGDVLGGAVTRFLLNPSTGALTLQETVAAPEAMQANHMAHASIAGGQSLLYVANNQSNCISGYLIAPDGTLSPAPGFPFRHGSRWPTGMLTTTLPDGSQALYVAYSATADLGAYRINPATGRLTDLAGSPFRVGGYPLTLALRPH